MPEPTPRNLSRRTFLVASAALCAPAAPALARGAGDVRLVRLASPHTGERISAAYWIEGAYVPEALAEISYFMRDWRAGLMVDIDPRTLDVVAAVQRLLDTDEPLQVLSGYRCAATNAMLRRTGAGVAARSYHLKGMAADLTARSRSCEQIARAATALRAGGVGRYPRSGFTHVDSGPVRRWRG